MFYKLLISSICHQIHFIPCVRVLNTRDDSSSGSTAIISKNLNVVELTTLGNTHDISTSKRGNMSTMSMAISESLSSEEWSNILMVSTVVSELRMIGINSSVKDVNISVSSVVDPGVGGLARVYIAGSDQMPDVHVTKSSIGLGLTVDNVLEFRMNFCRHMK